MTIAEDIRGNAGTTFGSKADLKLSGDSGHFKGIWRTAT